jgi:hypothetical protein
MAELFVIFYLQRLGKMVGVEEGTVDIDRDTKNFLECAPIKFHVTQTICCK